MRGGECTSERRGLHFVGNVKSPVDAALDGAAARLWAGVGDGALDACYGGVPNSTSLSTESRPSGPIVRTHQAL